MRRFLPLLVLSSLAFAPAPLPRRQAPDRGAADLEAMQGSWVLSYAHKDGVREDVSRRAVWAIEGDALTTSLDGKKGSSLFIKLDGGTSPRSLDLLSARDAKDPTPGRYSLEGDTLTACVGAQRPRDLSGYGPSNGVWVMKRVKR
jgi:uncharacterized protein (TIGR03067 family)